VVIMTTGGGVETHFLRECEGVVEPSCTAIIRTRSLSAFISRSQEKSQRSDCKRGTWVDSHSGRVEHRVYWLTCRIYGGF
jgi:hypothetical protein